MNNSDNNRINEQFKYYTILSVTYAILMVSAQSVAYRLIQVGSFMLPGGIFIFPATFVINDVTTEVYGPSLARRSIYIALLAQAFFTIIPIIVNTLPHPANWNHVEAYNLVFGRSWLIFISNLVAVSVAMLLNTQVMGKTKSRYHESKFNFMYRSLFCSTIGEFILTAIIVSIALVPEVGVDAGKRIFLNMFLFKTAFTIVAVIPASLLVVKLKKLDNADILEENISLNPLSKFFKKNEVIPKNLINFSERKKMREERIKDQEKIS